MNLLILSSGSRVKLVQYFVENFNESKHKVFTADCSNYAPSIYFSEKHFILPRITDERYIDELIKVCKENGVGYVLSLIDPELSLLAQNRAKLEGMDIIPIISSEETVELCFNKFHFHNFLVDNDIPTPKSFIDLKKVREALDSGVLDFPLFAKPVCGSASLNMREINNELELTTIERESIEGYIIQEFVRGKEYGVDIYVDLISGDIIDMFIKQKIKMRAGETDKSIAIESVEIERLVTNLVSKFDLRGPIDIDIFESNGKLLISEINPRFGGGYPHAYESGRNFVEYIIRNMKKIPNEISTNKFKKTIMLKYSDILILDEGE